MRAPRGVASARGPLGGGGGLIEDGAPDRELAHIVQEARALEIVPLPGALGDTEVRRESEGEGGDAKGAAVHTAAAGIQREDERLQRAAIAALRETRLVQAGDGGAGAGSSG